MDENVMFLPLPAVPDRCWSCGEEHSRWPLTVHGGRLQLVCPGCNVAAVPVVAVQDMHRHLPIGSPDHDPFGYLNR